MQNQSLKFNLLAALTGLVLVGMPACSQDAWQQFQDHATAVFEKANPFVVGITVKPQPPLFPSFSIGELDSESNLERVFGDEESISAESVHSLYNRKRVATGIVVDRGGYILTTGSILRSVTPEYTTVTLSNGVVLPATPVAQDSMSNLALFKVDRIFDDAPVFGNSQDLSIGSVVLAITRPYGRSNSLYMGLVSNLEQELGQARYESLIQTSVPLHPGSIGSPLLNFKGEVVGMLSTTQKQSSWPELSFAIPSEILEHIARELIQHGQVTRGFIGAWVNPLTPEIRLTRSIPEEVQGVIVRKVSPGDPAERAGIIAGDVITKFNDKVIGTYQELIWQTALAGPGNEIPVEIWRDGELRTLLVGLERFVLPSEIPKQP